MPSPTGTSRKPDHCPAAVRAASIGALAVRPPRVRIFRKPASRKVYPGPRKRRDSATCR
jgi:hypothetical protein